MTAVPAETALERLLADVVQVAESHRCSYPGCKATATVTVKLTCQARHDWTADTCDEHATFALRFIERDGFFVMHRPRAGRCGAIFVDAAVTALRAP